MKYRLIVITHDGPRTAKLLASTLRAFAEFVTPAPTDAVLVEDGAPKPMTVWRARRLNTGTDGPVGFCKTAAAAWAEAAQPGVDFVYWLEHDFLHTRPVDLSDLAGLLLDQPYLAQVSLMRGPENRQEIAAGSVRAAMADAFEEMPGWLEHDVYWTTNPALFRRAIPESNGWPDGPECEGKLTIKLRERGFSFAVWGDGEPWVEHVGQRTGFGY